MPFNRFCLYIVVACHVGTAPQKEHTSFGLGPPGLLLRQLFPIATNRADQFGPDNE